MPVVRVVPAGHETVTVNVSVRLGLLASSRAMHDTVVAVALAGNIPVCLVASLARNTRGLPTKLPVQVMVGSGVTLSVAFMAGKVTLALPVPAMALTLMGTAPVMASVGLTESGAWGRGQRGD
jgi:hypothetical protein